MTGPDPGSRGTLALSEQRCTSCLICVRECPAWCLHLTAHQEQEVPAAGGRPRTVNVLDTFDVDYATCMYCGICVDVCPVDALQWRPDPTPAEGTRDALRHDRARFSATW